MGGRADERRIHGGAPVRATALEQCPLAAGVLRPTQRSAAPDPQSKIQNPKSKIAFTLVELLVVITIIGLLIAVIAMVASHVLYAQKVNLTKTIMKNIAMALDQFAAEDPLRGVYDKRNAATFGAYPPYMLAGGGKTMQSNGVPAIVEPYAQYSQSGTSYVLQDRLHRDLNSRQGSVNDWARVNNPPGDPNEINDDIRALYIYLKLYSPAGLSQVPQTAIKPIPAAGKVDMVYPKGGADPNSAVDVFGIYDAWGVPFDYFLYVKLEWGPPPAGSALAGAWQVVDRKPVLRSRGVTLDEYKVAVVDPDKFIFSEDFPLPEANGPYTGPTDTTRVTFRKDGVMTKTNSQANGWARAPGVGDLDPNSFGYVP